jgi:LytS/YehU family sensor histidine kinase
VLQAWQIEPLLLLPLVENALKHGDLEMNSNAFLQISLHLSPEQLNFSVENSFDPSNAQKDAVGGVGLENVRHRLALHYASRHEFTASARENTFFASITLYAQ